MSPAHPMRELNHPGGNLHSASQGDHRSVMSSRTAFLFSGISQSPMRKGGALKRGRGARMKRSGLQMAWIWMVFGASREACHGWSPPRLLPSVSSGVWWFTTALYGIAWHVPGEDRERADSPNLDRDHNPKQFSHWLKGHAQGESHGPGDSSTPRSERHTGLNLKAPMPASTPLCQNPFMEPTTPLPSS